jgi:hypothetical protein
MAMAHSVQDGKDAAARARRSGARPRPIRYDSETWIVMRSDPVLPAAVILRLRNPDGREFFVTVKWDLDPAARRLIGRFESLEDADRAVLYDVPRPVVGRPDEDLAHLHQRQEEQARAIEQQRAERARLYGP